MRRLALKIAIVAAGLALAAYVVAVVVATAIQGRFFFHPDPRPADLAASHMDGFLDRTLVTADGERLRAWWRPPDPGKGVVLYLHGNGDNLAGPAPRLRDVAATGVGVLAIDYRGYGGSTGTPSEAGLYRDARAAWSFVKTAAPDRPVVIWGESLGTAVATQLATEVDETGVILDSPFSAMRRMVEAGAPWYPSILVSQRFDTAAKIARIGSPLIVAHCDTDEVVPFAEGRRVFAAARAPKEFIALQGCGHIQIWREPARARILDFLRQRLGASPG